jgi:hypothetical protein
MDTNLTNLNTDKLEVADLAAYETSVHAAATYATQTDLATTNSNLATTNSNLALTDIEVATKQDALPSQTGNNGKYLGTDGSVLSWNTVDALPTQTGNNGKYLTTNGTVASWATLNVDPNITTKGLYEHSATIAADYSVTAGNNAMSAGPITINSGVTVTVPSGSTWTVV